MKEVPKRFKFVGISLVLGEFGMDGTYRGNLFCRPTNTSDEPEHVSSGKKLVVPLFVVPFVPFFVVPLLVVPTVVWPLVVALLEFG